MMNFKYPIIKLKRLSPPLLKRTLKFWWQRRTRGWDDSVTWSLDYEIAKFILPRLKRFKKLTKCSPEPFSLDEWKEQLEIMIKAFEFISSDKLFIEPISEEVYLGLELFRKYYFSLWW